MKDFSRYGSVKCRGNTIIKFNEKKFCIDGLINGGIYLINRQFIESKRLPEVFSLEKEILEKEVQTSKLKCMIFDDVFIDIGIPEDYLRAESILTKMNKALFIDRDGVINVDKGHVFLIEDFEFSEGVFDLCRKYFNTGYLIIVVTNQAGIAKGLYTEEDFINLTDWMIGQFKDNGISITKVYYCPHHPEISGPCMCRKPESGMLLQAVKEFDLEISECILIGDKESDLEAGRRAGIPEENLYLFKY
jgi:D-glycero-D-manno-heptose 1,7-bisphosphate phosphatase